MDWKSIGFNKGKRIHSFKYFIILKSNHLTAYWVYVDDGIDTVEQSHQLCYLYSKHHNQLPKNDDPNIVGVDGEIRPASNGNYVLSISSPKNLYLRREDIQHEDECDLYSQLLSRCEHSPNYILASGYRDNGPEYPLSVRDSDISLPKQYEHLRNLLYEKSYDIQPYDKAIKFIETKVAAFKMQGFNHYLENKKKSRLLNSSMRLFTYNQLVFC